MKIRSTDKPSSPTEVNVIPLLDVVFAILSFFVLVSAGLAPIQKIGVDLPTKSQDTKAPQNTKALNEMLVVTLDIDGKTRIDGNLLTPEGLDLAIKGYIGAFPQGLVVLNAEDASVSYQQVVNTLEALRKVAGDRVAIATSKS
ncbi:biopolymer transport protein [Synechococcus sp. PCC 7502]|uniref:ExbD/TolR family protein n=1 Tax=Synechococcus sp. PCC 7502 TaxID=1173263 RepID=UPI00029FC11E|nr:biopolymer transporter ExbD [Synechococcus sp. PCC 7502]AFY73813.1 biopolymer transport protein [Synechococcus sp. PCC 7502]